MKDDAGELRGFSKITLDLTDHKLLESCVKERERTQRILKAATAGTWSWNPGRSEVTVCENFLRLLGHSGLGTQALEHAETEAAQAYMLDIGLPEMNGYELARRLRGQLTGNPVFVAVSGYGQETDRAEATRSGFSHYLVKPAD